MSAAWIRFGEPHLSASGKSKVWDVASIDGPLLGEIRWYGRWRCYAFYPCPNTLFERRCLRDIADFCERESHSQLKRAREPKP